MPEDKGALNGDTGKKESSPDQSVNEQGEEQGLFEVEYADGTKEVVTQEKYETMKERSDNYKELQSKIGELQNQLGHYKKGIDPSTQKPIKNDKTEDLSGIKDVPEFNIDSDDFDDPEELQKKMNQFAKNIFEKASEVSSKSAREEATKVATKTSGEQRLIDIANTVISGNTVLKKMEPEIARETFNAAVAAQNAINEKKGIEVRPTLAVYKEAVDNFLGMLGSSTKKEKDDEGLTQKHLIKTIKSIGGDEMVNPTGGKAHQSLAEKYNNLSQTERRAFVRKLEKDGRINDLHEQLHSQAKEDTSGQTRQVPKGAFPGD